MNRDNLYKDLRSLPTEEKEAICMAVWIESKVTSGLTKDEAKDYAARLVGKVYDKYPTMITVIQELQP